MKFLILSIFLVNLGFFKVFGENALGDLPEGVAGLADKIPGLENFNTSQISPEKIESVFKKKCEKYGGPEAFDKANEAKDVFLECIKNQLNFSTIQEEMDAAKPTGDLDMVFGKYCRKTPVVLDCLKTFTASLEPCLENKEKDNKNIVLNVTESLTNFLCHKDGDRIAMFIAEGGIECLQEKQDAIQECVNATFGSRIPSEVPDIDDLPLFVIEQEQCDDLRSLQKCVTDNLDDCKEPTPSNIVESLFKFIRKVTPCEDMDKISKSGKSATKSGATHILGSLGLILGMVFLKFF